MRRDAGQLVLRMTQNADCNNLETPIIPAPWHLTGSGFIVLFRAGRSFVARDAHLPAELLPQALGGIGALMIVRYTSSPVGPYDELLCIPARLRGSGRIAPFTISAILVSTLASVVGGRANWGMPKEQAGFDFSRIAATDHVHVFDQRGSIARFQLRAAGPTLPFSTAIIPPPLRTIRQVYAGKRFFTCPSGHGRIRPARLLQAEIDPARFPDIGRTQILATVAVERFGLIFPPAYTELLS
ncbi:MAG: acetoacetate decarboxylase family protein [Oscillochloris sp.]|nr:acetoacetate decarboxylase family protein [Oscillochloris sp.]